MIVKVVFAALALLAAYLFSRIRYARFEQYKKFPQHAPSLIWGHLKVMNDFIQGGKPDRHIDAVFSDMGDPLGNPPIMLIDARPASFPILVVNSYEVAEQVSRATKSFPWGAPKSPTLGGLIHLVGDRSILTREREEWKRLRKTFNPGFAPNHLHGLLPAILDKTWIFLSHLDRYVESGEEVVLNKLLINLTFDIIGAVVMDVDCDAQHEDENQGEMIRLYDELVHTYDNVRASYPWWFDPKLHWRRNRLTARIDVLIKDVIRKKHAEQQQSGSSNKSKSVLALSLQGTDKLDEDKVSETCDQVKTFLFAGHDTTSILLAWIFYELSRTPRALKAVRAELDDLFGPNTDPSSVREKLLAPGGEDFVGRMSYISAVIKEALRLHPPAGSARWFPEGTGFTVRTPQGDEVCVDGIVMYLCASIIQRDRTVYGDSADDFVPERWLGDTDTSENTNNDEKEKDGRKIPAGAWRPFERGPRSCIGQELANIEARVILAVVARRYDFVKTGLGEIDLDEKGQPMLDEKGQYKVKSELYSTIQVTAKPVDGMRVKVRLTPN